MQLFNLLIQTHTHTKKKHCWLLFNCQQLKLALLTSGHPVQCVSPRYHGSAIHSLGLWNSSGANQETGWYPRARSTPLHKELTEQKRGEKLRWGRGPGDRENDERGDVITTVTGKQKNELLIAGELLNKDTVKQSRRGDKDFQRAFKEYRCQNQWLDNDICAVSMT